MSSSYIDRVAVAECTRAGIVETLLSDLNACFERDIRCATESRDLNTPQSSSHGNTLNSAMYPAQPGR